MKILKADYSIAVDRALVERGAFHDFVCMAWPHVEPSAFVDNWHIEEVCCHLEAVSRGEILRLVINQPPGTAKSSIVSVFWNAWEWITRPDTKWMYASYDASLVGRDANKVVGLLQSDWFIDRWGERLVDTRPATSNFATLAGGFRFSTSPAGKATGRHVDIQVCDDPIKPKDAAGGSTMTKNALRFVSNWWSGTMSTRAVELAKLRRVICMQRLHEEDLAGEMLATGKWEHLMLPMRYEAARRCVTPFGGDRRTVEGELLFPARFPDAAVSNLETFELGPAASDAQLQQRPSQKGGGTFKRAWFRFWHTKPGVPEPCLCDRCVPKLDQAWNPDPSHSGDRVCEILPSSGLDLQSWDMTFKDKSDNDYVSGGVWRADGRRCFQLYCHNERLNFTDTLHAVRWVSGIFPSAWDTLIEDAANGPAVETMLKAELPGIVMVGAQGGKEARANAASPSFSSGSVFLPHPSLAPPRAPFLASWVWGYMRQLEVFPNGVHDDMVDQTTQALIRLRQFGNGFSEAMARIRNTS